MKPLSKQNTVDFIFLNDLESVKVKIGRLGSRSRTELTFRLVCAFHGSISRLSGVRIIERFR